MNEINWLDRAKNTHFQVRNVIDGQYETCSSDETITKRSPRDGTLLYEFGAGNQDDVNRAVANARESFEDGRWRDLSVHQRKAVLHKLADLIEANREEFALYECLDVGKPIANAYNGDVPAAASNLRDAAEGADKLLSLAASDGGMFCYQAQKPVGVVAGILGWNVPLKLATDKIGPALAMGNSLVLKPSEFTSLSTCRVAELALEAGVPAGVLNVVNGAGKTVGDALAKHPDVDLLTFVGSSATGKQLQIAAGQSNMKRLILECGGKSPYLVFDDCPNDLDFIAADIVAKAFPNQGAVCSAGTRLLLQDNIKDQLLPKILERTRNIVPADPLDTSTSFGALINEAHLNKVLGYIESGREQGANLLCGGERVNRESGGYYLQPALFDQVDPRQKIAQEEIFGPVLSMFSFSDEAQAIRLANDSRYGLTAFAATQNFTRAVRLGQRLNTGLLMVAASATHPRGAIQLPLAAHKESGLGVEKSLAGLAAYTASTAVYAYSYL